MMQNVCDKMVVMMVIAISSTVHSLQTKFMK